MHGLCWVGEADDGEAAVHGEVGQLRPGRGERQRFDGPGVAADGGQVPGCRGGRYVPRLTAWWAAVMARVRPSGENAIRFWALQFPQVAIVGTLAAAAMVAIRCGAAGRARSHSCTVVG